MIRPKFVFSIFVCLLPILTASTGDETKEKNFHLIYVSLSDVSNRSFVINHISNYLEPLKDSEDQVVFIISNGNKPDLFVSLESKDDVFSVLNLINPYAPNEVIELEKLVDLFYENNILFTSNETDPLSSIFKQVKFSFYLDEKILTNTMDYLYHRLMVITELKKVQKENLVSASFFVESNNRDLKSSFSESNINIFNE